MKFFIGVCLFALAASAYGYRIARDTSHEEFMKMWSDDEEKEYLEIATQYCKNVSGTDDGVEKIFNGLKEFFECSTKVFNPQALQESFKEAVTDDSHEDTAELFKDMCPKTKEVYKCFDHFKTYLPLCLDSEDMEAVDLLVRLVKKVFDFACYNNGEHVIKFLENDGMECITEHADEFEKCYDDAKEKYTKKVEEDLEDKDIDFKITKEDCDEYDNQNHCLVDKLKTTCTKKAISEVVHEFFVAIKGELRCENVQNVV